MKKYVIIGNGVAGVSAAERIRSTDPEGSITIFSQEPEPFYYRVRLPEVVAGEAELKQITIHDEKWYESRNIDLRMGEEAASIDPEAQTVAGSKGTEQAYDELLLAVGARSFIPPAAGSDKKGVFALRSAADARAIAQAAEGADSAILVGGGLLGLEAGYGLTRRGLKVQVVEFFDRLLPRQMDPAGAEKLQRHLEKMGFSFYLGAKTKEIIGKEKAEGLVIEDGPTLSGGLVLFSAGIRPNLDLARAAGLETDKGVKVDDRLQTSRPGIRAAGDLIEHRGRVYGIWPAAQAQGRAAGLNMAGVETEYTGTIMSNSLKVVGIDLTAAGEIDPEGTRRSAVYEDEREYRKIVMEDGRIIGFIFFGLTTGVRECQKAMEKGIDVSRAFESMKDKDFDFSSLAPA